MDCTKIQEQMLNEMGGRGEARSVSQGEARSGSMLSVSPDLSAHMSTCADCSNLWQAMQASSAALDEWTAPEPSPYFNTRFQARLAEVKREEAAAPAGAFAWLKQSFWRPAMVGALTLALAVGVGLYQRPVANNGDHNVQVSPAVNDLQKLDKNEDLYADFEMLDDLQTDGQQPQATTTTSDSKTEL